MFGINGTTNDDHTTPTDPPMVPNSDGIDQPAHMMPHHPDDRTPSAPPMPEGPAAPSAPGKPTIRPLPGHLTSSDPPPPPAPPTAGATPTDDLLKLKQEALHNLAPLIDHLDQTPEEKFKTTMMMLQASDNEALVKEAYASANAIKDDKIRAQALLDVVNEINYFTQHKHKN